jgi:4'-phosphopantetheinyl transferase
MPTTVLPLREGECQVWWARRQDCRPELAGLLDPAERGRLAALVQPADQERFTVGAALVRSLMGALTGVRPQDVVLDRTCPDCGRPHGRITVPGGAPRLSLSHSGDLVAVALHPTAEVGVDVEQVARGLDPLSLAGVALTGREEADLRALPAEQHPAAFAGYWVRKEAFVKATGEGLRRPPGEVEVTAPGTPPRLLSAYPGPVWLGDLSPRPGYAAAVAVLAEGPVLVREFDGTALLAETARH